MKVTKPVAIGVVVARDVDVVDEGPLPPLQVPLGGYRLLDVDDDDEQQGSDENAAQHESGENHRQGSLQVSDLLTSTGVDLAAAHFDRL